MDPNAREPGNQGSTQGGIVADKPVNNTSPDPLSNLQDVVNAAKKEAVAAQTPRGQFVDQFGEPTAPPVAEPAPDLMGQALANPEPANNSQPAPEVTLIPQPEEAPLDPKQKFINTVAAAYEELKAAG